MDLRDDRGNGAGCCAVLALVTMGYVAFQVVRLVLGG
jgi:hypothetical protein